MGSMIFRIKFLESNVVGPKAPEGVLLFLWEISVRPLRVARALAPIGVARPECTLSPRQRHLVSFKCINEIYQHG